MIMRMDFSDFVRGDSSISPEFLIRRVIAMSEEELFLVFVQPGYGTTCVGRKANLTGLIANRPSHGLLYPPRTIGCESVTPSPIIFLHGSHETHVPLLDKIEQRHSVMLKPCCEMHHKTQISLDEFIICCGITPLFAFAESDFLCM